MVTISNPQTSQDGISLLDRARARALGRAFDLEAMAEGWLDEEGRRPQAAALKALRNSIQSFPSLFLNSGIFPTPEGGILLEETLGKDEAELLIADDGTLELSWNGASLPNIADLEKQRRATLTLPVPSLEPLFSYDSAPIVLRGETGLGRLHGFALPEGEPFSFVGFIAGQKIWRAFLHGRCCLREVHLDMMTRIFLFDSVGTLAPVEDVLKEAWLPDPGLMVRDLPLEKPFS